MRASCAARTTQRRRAACATCGRTPPASAEVSVAFDTLQAPASTGPELLQIYLLWKEATARREADACDALAAAGFPAPPTWWRGELPGRPPVALRDRAREDLGVRRARVRSVDLSATFEWLL